MSSPSQPAQPSSNRVRIVVATSVMLTFISFWRASAIILNDLGSSAFYAGGIAEQAVGKAAPWFVLGIMLFSFAVRAVYVESCSMFVRGGVYRIVKEALGGRLAKVAVSAMMFDYILTGPISGVSAGQYIAGLVNETFISLASHGWLPSALLGANGHAPQVPVNATSVVLACAVTMYYWWQNVKGIEESSEKAMRVMQVTTIMVVLLLGWSILTLLERGGSLPPLPLPRNLHFDKTSLGFLNGSHLAALSNNFTTMFGLFGIIMAFGHSVLAMSGEESLAQVYREIASPKLKNLKRTALIIAIYSTVFTGGATLLASMLIPDAVRGQYKDNLIAGLAMYLIGPQILRLLFRVFVVVVGFLMLSGAINTAIVGSNGVLNRVSEDGVLTDWFRHPHHKYGTSNRIINLVVALQLIIIVASRGDVYVLGEAYAFGLMWSFVFNSLSMLVLRFKFKGERGWKVPPNLHLFGHEIPIGLVAVFLVLFTTSVVNLFTKSVATIGGIIFTVAFFIVFTVSEHINRKKYAAAEQQMKEQFQLVQSDTIAHDNVGIRPGNALITVRDYNNLGHLRWALERMDTKDQDVVVLTARVTRFSAGGYDLGMDQIFSDYEQTLFTRAVSVAENVGKKISLMVVPATDIWSAIAQTARALDSSIVVAGLSAKMEAQEQAFQLGRAWEAMAEPKRQFLFQVVHPEGKVDTFTVGPHTPHMRPEDVHLVHRLWLDLTRYREFGNLHHSDIVSIALTRFARDYAGRDRDEILKALRKGPTDKRFGITAAALPAPIPPTAPAVQPSVAPPTEPAPPESKEPPETPPVTGP